jgi:hypothetical protein
MGYLRWLEAYFARNKQSFPQLTTKLTTGLACSSSCVQPNPHQQTPACLHRLRNDSNCIEPSTSGPKSFLGNRLFVLIPLSANCYQICCVTTYEYFSRSDTIKSKIIIIVADGDRHCYTLERAPLSLSPGSQEFRSRCHYYATIIRTRTAIITTCTE